MTLGPSTPQASVTVAANLAHISIGAGQCAANWTVTLSARLADGTTSTTPFRGTAGPVTNALAASIELVPDGKPRVLVIGHFGKCFMEDGDHPYQVIVGISRSNPPIGPTATVVVDWSLSGELMAPNGDSPPSGATLRLVTQPSVSPRSAP